MKDKHAYIEKKCLNCKDIFQGRKDRKTNRWCSQECFQKFIERKNSHALTAKDVDIINGIVLSDGCITKNHSNKNYYLTTCSIIENYIDFLLSELSFPIRKSHHQFRGKAKNQYHLTTAASPIWTRLRKQWYPEGKKIVPEIDLCPVTCLHWFLGDGHLDNKSGIILCTDCFDPDFIQFLRDNLHELGFNTLTNAKNRVIIPNSSVYEFLKYIGMSPVPEFSYKWDTIVKQSYRGRSCLQCGTIFDAKVNHNVYCADKCYKLAWKRRQSRPVAVRKSG